MSVSLPIRTPSWVSEFRAFIMRGNVIDLAVGIVIGVAFTAVVNSLVKDILNPFIGLLAGGIDFSNWFIPLNGQHYPTLEAARAAGAPTVNVGVFINSVINFLIVSFAIFWVIKVLSKLRIHREAEAAGPTRTELLLTDIRDELRARPVTGYPSS